MGWFNRFFDSLVRIRSCGWCRLPLTAEECGKRKGFDVCDECWGNIQLFVINNADKIER